MWSGRSSGGCLLASREPLPAVEWGSSCARLQPCNTRVLKRIGCRAQKLGVSVHGFASLLSLSLSLSGLLGLWIDV